MTFQSVLFWIFSVALLGSGLLVITRHNAIHSAMFMIQLILSLAGLFLLLEAFFLALVQVLVYAGAVVVLFLFVIMLLDTAPSTERVFPRMAIMGSTALTVVIGLEFYILMRKPIGLEKAGYAAMQGGLRDVLKPLFTKYLLPLELTALIMIVGMIGIVLLSKKEPR